MRSVSTRVPAAILVLAALLSGVPALMAAGKGSGGEPGREAYMRDCAPCHGKKGRGDGEKARRLGFRPRDFHLGAFKCRCTPMGKLPSDEDLVRTVTQGMPGTPMQKWEGKLTADEIREVVEFVKTLTPQYAEETAPPCIPVPEPPASTGERVAEGRQIYKILQCWKCHGPTGRGDGPAAEHLVDDWGDRIRAYDFTKPNRFKCGGEPRDLYRTLLTGLMGTPMPSWEDAFLFTSENHPNLKQLGKAHDANAEAELTAFIQAQPDPAAIKEMSDAQRRSLIDERAWALVHYLITLRDEPSE